MKRRLAAFGALIGLLLQPLSVLAIDTTYDIKLTAQSSGTSVGGRNAIGDVNNDGYDDVIVGDVFNGHGKVFIYYGSASGPSITPTKTLDAVENDTTYGYAVAAGDFNNDGYDDVVIGARDYNNSTGRSYIYFGGASMDTTADASLTGEATDDTFGSVLASGDVNNDGYADVIVSAPRYNSSTGRVYVFLGGASIDTTADVTMTGGGTGDKFGSALDSGADVNNDGYDDVIVGASTAFEGVEEAYIFLGGSSMNNTADVEMSGVGGSRFGYSVAFTGDVNGDNYDDAVVGAPLLSETGLFGIVTNPEIGRAYLFLGGSSMDSSADLTITGEALYDHFGSVVAAAGDSNDDGYSDVLIGADQYPTGAIDGRVYLFYGSSSPDDTADVLFDAEHSADNFGGSVKPIVWGDVNGDTSLDIIIGAPAADGGASDGAVYIYLGPDVTDPTVSTLSPADGAIDVAVTDNLVITFDEVVEGDSGNITIKKTSDDSVVETITALGGLVSGFGSSVITIDPSVTLANSTSYYVNIQSNAFKDAASNFFSGISTTTEWNFQTIAAASSSSAGSSSSSSVSAEERQGSGGGRGGGSTTRQSVEIQQAVQERFNVTPAEPARPAATTEQVREQRKIRVQQMLNRREQRKQLRLQRLQGR